MHTPNATKSYEPSSTSLHEAVSAWFLGPQAENGDLLKQLFDQIIDSHAEARKSYHPEDGEFITPAMKNTTAFNETVKKLKAKFHKLSRLLADKSIPFYSPRYAGHMSFESSLPSIVGWLAALLFNPNNVAFEASPVTTLLELDAGSQLCDMLGFKRTDSCQPWGHITCDGTASNIESIWAARNLKFYPLSLREAMRPGEPLAFICSKFCVHSCMYPGELVPFKDLNLWELLNLRPDEILSIPNRLHSEFGISSDFLENALRPFLIQSTGKEFYQERYGIEHPQYLVSSTRHYSWPKGAALTGIGSQNMINVPVDQHGRMDPESLRRILDEHLRSRRAIYAVVAIIGSTEEGAVDPLAEILALRSEYQLKGLSFIVHADAAWGGYFASMIREDLSQELKLHSTAFVNDNAPRVYIPSMSLKDHTLKQIEALADADSVTIDPHKSGYCSYPAGDGRLRFLLTWSAPYLNQGENGESIGIYGVEGSKPGAAAAAVYLHHVVVGLHKGGHGSLLGEVCFSCARISAHWAAMSNESSRYLVVPFNRLRSEPDVNLMEMEKQFIREKIISRSNQEILQDPNPEVFAEIRALGSDLNINAFACNFRIENPLVPGSWIINDDVEEANYLNKCIFDRLSVTSVHDNPLDIPMFISSTTFSQENYGECLRLYKERLGLETDSEQDLFVLRNVVMSPFQATATFASKVADTFRKTLEEEMEHVVARNTISPQEHSFIMQGTDQLFLVYRPHFYDGNGRQQLILTCEFAEGSQLSRYLNDREAHKDEIYTLNIPAITIDTILLSKFVKGFVYRKGTVVLECEICNIRIIKNRSLASKWRDQHYPSNSSPFYLYGTPNQQHIDHMLLKAPNAQLSAEDVELLLDTALSLEQLQYGVLLYLNVFERAMQPFNSVNQPFFFTPGAEIPVEIYEDPFPPTAHGPGLAPSDDQAAVFSPMAIATGLIRLGNNLFVDYDDLNKEDNRVDVSVSSHSHAGVMSEQGKAGWRNMLSNRMQTELKDDVSGVLTGVNGKQNEGAKIALPRN
ncbi:hypothetical protein D9613_008569 [Agrocybe pediades]|uniref:L-tyrosine decarboxylase C-terminal domain-containing protein n=1 Tax=Agrocybe pediades TaxID=84607 RepID=A0A8H4QTK0_9AGAR|nr:hypothetical protein D9613_008569 [Agrocybe pediades]